VSHATKAERTRSSSELLARLVGFDTTSCNSNLGLIADVEEYLHGLGVETMRADLEPGKTNLVATIGPMTDGGIVLSGHTDVVPVEGQKWSTDPFALHASPSGNLHGRGTCDMKGFLACCLAAVPVLQARPLSRPVHLVFSCDEEVTCEGVLPAIRRFGVDMPRPSVCIVGEPTMMQVVTGQKACQAYVTTVTGVEAHSSRPLSGWNALSEAAMMVAELDRLAAEMRERADAASEFDPPYTTVHAGVLNAGAAVNIVPNTAELWWEARLLPGQDEAEIRDRMATWAEARNTLIRQRFPHAGISTVNYVNVPGLAPEPDGEARSLALRLSGSNRTSVVSYASEAGHFHAAGMSTVLCGPGSIDQAHAPDEFIATSQLGACDRFLDALADSLQRD
jgi:acetylornithine deacetylase